ncbi:MAG: TraR/DksA C4-type zinc finger protein [Anaerolineae bacterium]|nr:TraR/DksA C4-type zinc finger protein [Anaerolineae bacterium]
MKHLDELLRDCVTHHHRLCPQVLVHAREHVGASSWPSTCRKRTSACSPSPRPTAASWMASAQQRVATWVGARCVEDFRKVAAVFVDTQPAGVRIAPRLDVRRKAAFAPEARSRWEAQLLGYQRMPDEDLLDSRWVTMRINIAGLIGHAGVRVNCEACGEEIINQREVTRDARILCRACAGQAYYVETRLAGVTTLTLPWTSKLVQSYEGFPTPVEHWEPTWNDN